MASESGAMSGSAVSHTVSRGLSDEEASNGMPTGRGGVDRFSEEDSPESQAPDLDWILEQRPDVAASFHRVLELTEEFQNSLEPTQRRCWLKVEEALLDHLGLMQEVYYAAGKDSVKEASTGSEDLRCIVQLARAIERVALRGI